MAALALLLSAVGVFGVMAFFVSQRTHEMGVRAALGAGAGRILREMLGEGMRLVGGATILGVLVALAATRVLRGFLFDVETGDPWVFAAALAVVLAAGFLACYLPARRATRVDPAVALKAEERVGVGRLTACCAIPHRLGDRSAHLSDRGEHSGVGGDVRCAGAAEAVAVETHPLGVGVAKLDHTSRCGLDGVEHVVVRGARVEVDIGLHH